MFTPEKAKFRVISGVIRRTLYIPRWTPLSPILRTEGSLVSRDSGPGPERDISSLLDRLQLITNRPYILYMIHPYPSAVRIYLQEAQPECIQTTLNTRQYQFKNGRQTRLVGKQEPYLDWSLGGWQIKGESNNILFDGVIPAGMHAWAEGLYLPEDEYVAPRLEYQERTG